MLLLVVTALASVSVPAAAPAAEKLAGITLEDMRMVFGRARQRLKHILEVPWHREIVYTEDAGT